VSLANLSPRPQGDTRRADLMRTLAAVAATSTAKMAAENFPVALRLLPRAVRDDLTRLYAFARFVDDVGDDPDDVIGAGADRLVLLDLVEAELHRVAEQTEILAPVAGIAPMVRSGRVPLQPFVDLVEANRRDQRVTTYATFDDLLGYCRFSAAPVGRVVLHLAGAAGGAAVAESDDVCNALQVLEHCQDVAEDARAGRVYLPQVDLAAAGVATDELTAATASPQLRSVVALEAGRARDLLAAGRPLIRRLSGWARIAVSGFVAGGLATADALSAADHDVLARQVRPSRGRTVRHAVVLLARRS
jgi:squalene synthase HpnC